MEYSVIIPLFNEEESLPSLQEELDKVMTSLAEEYEIIYVNDGSNDRSLEGLNGLREKYPRLRIVSLQKNSGQSAAWHAGFINATGKWIITLDADGQNPPEEIRTLIKYKNEFDFITGIRFNRKDSLSRKLSSQTAMYLRWLILRDKTQDTGCSLRIFKREIITKLPFFKNFHRFFTFLVRESNFSVKEVSINHQPRKFGSSKYGIIGRFKAGIFDLWGVFWLKKRLLHYEINGI